MAKTAARASRPVVPSDLHIHNECRSLGLSVAIVIFSCKLSSELSYILIRGVDQARQGQRPWNVDTGEVRRGGIAITVRSIHCKRVLADEFLPSNAFFFQQVLRPCSLSRSSTPSSTPASGPLSVSGPGVDIRFETPSCIRSWTPLPRTRTAASQLRSAPVMADSEDHMYPGTARAFED